MAGGYRVEQLEWLARQGRKHVDELLVEGEDRGEIVRCGRTYPHGLPGLLELGQLLL
jgi:hypothetical protein